MSGYLHLNDESLPDLLYYTPRDYRDYTKVLEHFGELNLDNYEVGERVCALTRIVSIEYFDNQKRATTLFEKESRRPVRADVVVDDRGFKARGGRLKFVIFGNVWVFKDVKPGDDIFFSGKVSYFRGETTLSNPEPTPLALAGKILPVYPALRGRLSADDVRLAIQEAYAIPGLVEGAAGRLSQHMGMLPETIERYAKIPAERLLRAMHDPQSIDQFRYSLHAARNLTIAMIMRRALTDTQTKGAPIAGIAIDRAVVREVVARVTEKFNLTGDQKRSISEILQDLASPYAMNRLLSGDVGTGKTITFLMPAIIAHRCGASVVILAPNELVSNQIGDEVLKLFPDMPVQVVNGKTKKLEPGAFLVGTTALHSRLVKDGRPIDLFIVDEQHKFSREQREGLLQGKTNFLEATATAIPRTMALVTHAGMSVSQLAERPFVRDIKTQVLVGEKHKRELAELVQATLEAGSQMAIVYPAVQKSEEMMDVNQAADQWEKALPGKVVRLHGKMKSEEKAEAIQAFRERRYQLLITSTVIEVGVSLPDLRGIIIVKADRYGVAQLHQLRGRVARLGGKGDCVLYCPNPITEETEMRLWLLRDNDNGFKLAEADLEQRGFGDLDADSDDQNGRSLYVFHNLHITPSDLKRVRRGEKAQPASRKAPAPQ